MDGFPHVREPIPVLGFLFPLHKKSYDGIKLAVVKNPIRIEPVAAGVLINEVEVIEGVQPMNLGKPRHICTNFAFRLIFTRGEVFAGLSPKVIARLSKKKPIG